MIDVFGAGWKAARELGVLQQLRAVGHAFQELRYIDATGRTTASIPLARVSRSLDHEFDISAAARHRAGATARAPGRHRGAVRHDGDIDRAA